MTPVNHSISVSTLELRRQNDLPNFEHPCEEGKIFRNVNVSVNVKHQFIQRFVAELLMRYISFTVLIKPLYKHEYQSETLA